MGERARRFFNWFSDTFPWFLLGGMAWELASIAFLLLGFHFVGWLMLKAFWVGFIALGILALVKLYFMVFVWNRPTTPEPGQ